MKKALASLLSLIIAVGFVISCFAVEFMQSPVIIETVYPTDDVVIADIIATQAPYNADNTGKSDGTHAILKAIDDCFENSISTCSFGWWHIVH